MGDLLMSGLRWNVFACDDFNVMLLTKQVAAGKIVEKRNPVCDRTVIPY